MSVDGDGDGDAGGGHGESTCCPNCRSMQIKLSATQRHSDKPRYYCRECGDRFDDPDVRERQSPGHSNGLANKLAKSDTAAEAWESFTEGDDGTA